MKKVNNNSKKPNVLLVEDSFLDLDPDKNNRFCNEIYGTKTYPNIEKYRKDLSDKLKNKLGKNIYIDLCFDVNSAMNNLNSEKYDLVVSDIQLPISVKFDKMGYLVDNQKHKKNQKYFDELSKIFERNSEYVVKHFKKIPSGTELIIPFFETALVKKKKFPAIYKRNEQERKWMRTIYLPQSYGLIVADQAKNKGIPTVLYSDAHAHGSFSIEEAFAGGFLSINGMQKLYRIYYNLSHIEKEDYFYLGPKENLDNFAEVIKREIKQRE